MFSFSGLNSGFSCPSPLGPWSLVPGPWSLGPWVPRLRAPGLVPVTTPLQDSFHLGLQASNGPLQLDLSVLRSARGKYNFSSEANTISPDLLLPV